jgi:hypothetical protein
MKKLIKHIKYFRLNEKTFHSGMTILYLLFAFFLNGCDLLSTRSPEKPDTGRSTFQPPTDAGIVIENFKNAFKENNTENFIACLSDTSQTKSYLFTYVPTAEANGIYASIFQSWTISSERRAFNSIITKIQEGTYLDLTFENPHFELTSPDSTVFVSNYQIKIYHNIATIPKIFAGTVQFTIVPASNGLWSIYRWTDTKLNNDTIKDTWSILKAQFYN